MKYCLKMQKILEEVDKNKYAEYLVDRNEYP